MSEVVSLSDARKKAMEAESEADAIEAKRAAAEFERQLEESHAEVVTALEGILDLARAGRIEGFCFIGQDNLTGHFCSETHLRAPTITRSQAYAYAGAIDAIKLDLIDHAALAPVIRPDGTTYDPLERIMNTRRGDPNPEESE